MGGSTDGGGALRRALGMLLAAGLLLVGGVAVDAGSPAVALSPRTEQAAPVDEAPANEPEATESPADPEPTESPAPEVEPEPQQTEAPVDSAPASETPAAEDPEQETGPILEHLQGLQGLVGLGALAASSGPLAGFKPGYIISDAKFYNGSAMTATEVQNFLNRQVSNPTPRSLRNYAQKTTNKPADNLCAAYTGKSNETAAQIIAKVGKACGISQRVLLVMLQKEQTLVTNRSPSDQNYNRAMGYACPDSGPNHSANCDTAYYGFFNQVWHGTKRLKQYRVENHRFNYHPFKANPIQWHPDKAKCGTSQVYIQNWATASLYIYTPYRPNQAALNAYPGEGDACSTYGNRNFYASYKIWFGTPNTAFPDVPEGHKFFSEIEWMSEEGLTTGVRQSNGGEPLYKPKAAISREAMAAFLYRLDGANFKAPAVSPFADVHPGDKFYREITWMHEQGLATGTKQPSGKPKFEPKASVSRSAMAAFLYRRSGESQRLPSSSPFADVKPSDKFYREIVWMRESGISTGNKQPSGKPKYASKEAVSREAMAAFLYRAQHRTSSDRQ